MGIGATQHKLVTTGLGHSHAARASLASVLKEGEKEIPTKEAEAEAECLLPPVQRALWKVEERIVNPKETSMKGSLGGKSDCLKLGQYEFPCE